MNDKAREFKYGKSRPKLWAPAFAGETEGGVWETVKKGDALKWHHAEDGWGPLHFGLDGRLPNTHSEITPLPVSVLRIVFLTTGD